MDLLKKALDYPDSLLVLLKENSFPDKLGCLEEALNAYGDYAQQTEEDSEDDWDPQDFYSSNEPAFIKKCYFLTHYQSNPDLLSNIVLAFDEVGSQLTALELMIGGKDFFHGQKLSVESVRAFLAHLPDEVQSKAVALLQLYVDGALELKSDPKQKLSDYKGHFHGHEEESYLSEEHESTP